jgi:hypothetical protein
MNTFNSFKTDLAKANAFEVYCDYSFHMCQTTTVTVAQRDNKGRLFFTHGRGLRRHKFVVTAEEKGWQVPLIFSFCDRLNKDPNFLPDLPYRISAKYLWDLFDQLWVVGTLKT